MKKLIYLLAFLCIQLKLQSKNSLVYYVNPDDCVSCLNIADKIAQQLYQKSIYVLTNNDEFYSDFKKYLSKRNIELNRLKSTAMQEKYNNKMSSVIVYDVSRNLELFSCCLFAVKNYIVNLNYYFDNARYKSQISGFKPITINNLVYYQSGDSLYSDNFYGQKQVAKNPDLAKVNDLIKDIRSREAESLKRIGLSAEAVEEEYKIYLKQRCDKQASYFLDSNKVYHVYFVNYIYPEIKGKDTLLNLTGDAIMVESNKNGVITNHYYIVDTLLDRLHHFYDCSEGFTVKDNRFYFLSKPESSENKELQPTFLFSAKINGKFLVFDSIISKAQYKEEMANLDYQLLTMYISNEIILFNSYPYYYQINKQQLNKLIFPDSISNVYTSHSIDEIYQNIGNGEKDFPFISLEDVLYLNDDYQLALFTHKNALYVAYFINNKIQAMSKVMGINFNAKRNIYYKFNNGNIVEYYGRVK